MASFNTFYNLGDWGYMGVGPTPNKGFNLTVSYYQYGWYVPLSWEKMGILFYKIGDTTKYAVHKTAVLDVVGGEIVSSTDTSQTVELSYDADNWDFYGGFTVSDLSGAAICFFTKEPAGTSGSAPNGFDYASIDEQSSKRPYFRYTVITTRFANKIDGSDIYAKRAECDSDGNPINSTYATKAELAGKQDELTAGDNINIDSDGVISATFEAETYTAGPGINIDSDNVVSMDSDAIPTEPVSFGSIIAGNNISFEDSDGDLVINAADAPTYTQGNGIIIDSDGVVSLDSDSIPSEPVSFGHIIAGRNITFEDSDGDVVINAADAPTYSQGSGIDIDSDGVVSVDSSIATKNYVDLALNGKQDDLTGITDVMVVNTLPATPVATVLYLIPEAT